MEYLFDEGKANGKKFILLHGTGGDENSLIEVARFLDEDSTILSFRGEIEEDGMNRFFRRNGLNQFDIPNLELETDILLAEIERHSKEQGIALAEWTIIGYSNGANIAAHLLLERETELKTAILLHPMFLGVANKQFSLSEKSIWLSYGQNDPIVSETAFNDLVTNLENRSGNLSINIFDKGHQVTLEELESAKSWLESFI